MLRSLPASSKMYPLLQFLGWAHHGASDDRTREFIGPLRSVHLFRSRSAPLHHEFTILRFSGAADSWLRVERAARLKVGGRLAFQADSLGPMFGVVALRESASFGRSKRTMSADADELAVIEVSNVSGDSRASVHLHLWMDQVARQLAEQSSAAPLYRIFTVNCRW